MRAAFCTATMLAFFSQGTVGCIADSSSTGTTAQFVVGIEERIEKLSSIHDIQQRKAQAGSLIGELDRFRVRALSPTVRAKCRRARIQIEIRLENFAAARDKIIQAFGLLDQDAVAAKALIEELLVPVAELRRTGQDSAAQLCETKLLRAVASRADLDAFRCDLLEMALFRGLYAMVQASARIGVDMDVSAFSDYGCYCVRARAAAGAYGRYAAQIVRRGPTRTETRDLRRLSDACARAYEAAYCRSPSDFERVRLSAQWLGVSSHRHFRADSVLLRQAFPANLSTRVDRQLLKKRTESFRRAVERALDVGADGKRLTPEMRKDLARGFAAIFERVGRLVPIPERAFRGIVADVEMFCDMSLPFAAKSNRAIEDTLTWYLWGALVRPVPSKVERRVIDQQVERFAKLMEGELDKALAPHPGFKPVGAACGKKFREFYRDYRGNRFVPYFKEAMLPYQESNEWRVLREDWRELSEGIVDAADYHQRRGPSDIDQRLEREIDAYMTSLLVCLYARLTAYDRPGFRIHLPNRVVYKCNATLRKHGLYVFCVKGTKPIAPFANKSSK